MIEWIKITPETEFPVNTYFIVTDESRFIHSFLSKGDTNLIFVNQCDRDYSLRIADMLCYTHYAIINLLEEDND